MPTSTAQSLVWTLIIVLIAAGLALAGSQEGQHFGSVPVFALCGVLCFGLNWLAFVPAYAAHTERYYDLTGSLTYMVVLACALMLGNRDPRALLLALLVGLWALRLGSFLFARIRRDGSDGRFDEIKLSFARFLLTWTIQGLWVFFTGSAALAAMTATATESLGLFAALGTGVWIAGFAIEVVADRQKAAFRSHPLNRDRFIDTGLWAWSRHPNYFGEIMLWLGVAIVAFPVLSGWQLVTLISPVFVYLLLTRVTGIPLLESRSDERWGDDSEYQAYKARTPVLWLRPPAPV